MTLVNIALWRSVFCFSWDILIQVGLKFTVNWISPVYLPPYRKNFRTPDGRAEEESDYRGPALLPLRKACG